MPAVAGSILGLKANGAFVSCELSCSINFDRELLPATAVDSGGWKEFIYSVRSWSVSVNGNLLLEAVGSDIKSFLNAGYFESRTIYIQFSTRPSSDIQLVFSGTALFQSADITGANTGKANWNAKLQGSGKLAMTFQDYSLLIDAMPPESDYPTTIDQDVI